MEKRKDLLTHESLRLRRILTQKLEEYIKRTKTGLKVRASAACRCRGEASACALALGSSNWLTHLRGCKISHKKSISFFIRSSSFSERSFQEGLSASGTPSMI